MVVSAISDGGSPRDVPVLHKLYEFQSVSASVSRR